MPRSFRDIAADLAALKAEIDEAYAHAPLGSDALDALETVYWRGWEDAAEDMLRGLRKAAGPVQYRQYSLHIGGPYTGAAA